MLSDFMDIPLAYLVYASLVVFIAYTIKGLSGFGSGLIAVPLLAFILPLKVVVPVLGILSYGGTIIQSISLRKQAQWKLILPLIPFSITGVVLALWMLVNVDQNLLSLLLGCFVVVYSLYALKPVKSINTSKYGTVIAGCLGGFIGALFGTGGPFYVIYLKLRQLDKGQFRATIASIFLLDGAIRISAYGTSGLYTQQVITLTVIFIPLLLIALYVGNHIHVKINEHQFNRVVSLILFFSGIMLVIKSL